MVHCDHDRIIAVRNGVIGNEVHGDERKWAGVFLFDRLQGRVWWVSIDLVFLARGTSINIVLGECVEARPPVVSLYDFLSA